MKSRSCNLVYVFLGVAAVVVPLAAVGVPRVRNAETPPSATLPTPATRYCSCACEYSRIGGAIYSDKDCKNPSIEIATNENCDTLNGTNCNGSQRVATLNDMLCLESTDSNGIEVGKLTRCDAICKASGDGMSATGKL